MKKIASERHSNALSANRPRNPAKAATRKPGPRRVPAPPQPADKPGRRLVRLCADTGCYVPVGERSAPEQPVLQPELGCLVLPAPSREVKTLAARLDRGLGTPYLHITDPQVSQSFAMPPERVAGLADGAPVNLVPNARTRETVTYQLEAPPAAFAASMVGRVSRDAAERLYVEALQPHGPFYRMRLEPGTEALPGEVVVATLDPSIGNFARVAGKLDAPDSVLTAVCAVAAECGARFGHDAEVMGHAHNIRNDQRNPGPGMTDVPFFTLDPKGARVLDQAMHLERRPEGGYLLRYAIADGGALVPPGSPCDRAAAERGAAVYLPAMLPDDLKTALHLLPADITQDAGSLLEQQHRAAFVVSVKLDADCNILDCDAERTVIRSLQQVSTQQVQWYYDHQMSSRLVAQPFAPSLTLLREVGQKLVRRAKDRGAPSLARGETPDVVAAADGSVRTFERHDVEVSSYNGQISMLVNEAVAAKLAQSGVRAPFLGDAGLGVSEAQLRIALAEQGLAWPAGIGLDDFLATLAPDDARTVAARRLVAARHPATSFSAHPVPHSGLGLPAYINITAPLRRYQDMVGQRIVDAVITGTQPVPYQDDAAINAVLVSAAVGRERENLIKRRTHAVRATAFLQPHVGDTLAARVVASLPGCTLVELEGSRMRLAVPRGPQDPALAVHASGRVHVLEADVATRTCRLAWLGAQAVAV